MRQRELRQLDELSFEGGPRKRVIAFTPTGGISFVDGTELAVSDEGFRKYCEVWRDGALIKPAPENPWAGWRIVCDSL